jgi:hypothetical protein
MGRDCGSERVPITLAEGPTRGPPAESPALTAAFGQKTAVTGSAGVPTYLEGPESRPRPQACRARILRASAPWRLDRGDIDPLPAARRPAVALVVTAWPADRDGAIMFHRPGEVTAWLAVRAIVDFVQASEQVHGQDCSCQRRPRVGRRRGGVLLHPLAAQAPGQKPYSRPVSGLLRRELRR